MKVPWSFKTSGTTSQQHSVVSHNTWILRSAIICYYEINSNRKTKRESKPKAIQGQHLFREDYIFHVLLSFIPYVSSVQMSRQYETCHSMVHTYFICNSNMWKLCMTDHASQVPHTHIRGTSACLLHAVACTHIHSFKTCSMQFTNLFLFHSGICCQNSGRYKSWSDLL
jgi:hypothetical protein